MIELINGRDAQEKPIFKFNDCLSSMILTNEIECNLSNCVKN